MTNVVNKTHTNLKKCVFNELWVGYIIAVLVDLSESLNNAADNSAFK